MGMYSVEGVWLYTVYTLYALYVLYRTERGWDDDRALYGCSIQPYSQLHRIPIQRPIHNFCRPSPYANGKRMV